MALLKILGLIALVLAVGVLGTAITKLFRRRTIAAWFGSGVNDSLTPAQAALLIGLHPGPMLALIYHHLNRLGPAQVHASHERALPVRAHGTGGVVRVGPMGERWVLQVPAGLCEVSAESHGARGEQALPQWLIPTSC